MSEYVVVAISSETSEIAVFQGFLDENDAQEFLEADLFEPHFDRLAILPTIDVVKVENPSPEA